MKKLFPTPDMIRGKHTRATQYGGPRRPLITIAVCKGAAPLLKHCSLPADDLTADIAKTIDYLKKLSALTDSPEYWKKRRAISDKIQKAKRRQ